MANECSKGGKAEIIEVTSELEELAPKGRKSGRDRCSGHRHDGRSKTGTSSSRNK